MRGAALQFMVIGGGFFVIFSGEPIWYLVVLVGLKIIVDLAVHIKSHTPMET